MKEVILGSFNADIYIPTYIFFLIRAFFFVLSCFLYILQCSIGPTPWERLSNLLVQCLGRDQTCLSRCQVVYVNLEKTMFESPIVLALQQLHCDFQCFNILIGQQDGKCDLVPISVEQPREITWVARIYIVTRCINDTRWTSSR